MLQSSVGSQDITVARLTHSGRTGNYYVGLRSRHLIRGMHREKCLGLGEAKFSPSNVVAGSP